VFVFILIRGTGFVHIDHPNDISFTLRVQADPEYKQQLEDSNVLAHLSSENGALYLLNHRIVDGIDYQRQGETIITWCERSTGLDLALSFQDTLGCSYVWQLVEKLLTVGEGEAESQPAVQLPSVMIENLDSIREKLTNLTNTQKDYLAALVLSDEASFVRQLFALRQSHEQIYENPSEELETRWNSLKTVLEPIHAIFTTIFLLNDPSLIELLLSDEYIIETAACLEYDLAYSATRQSEEIRIAQQTKLMIVQHNLTLPQPTQNQLISGDLPSPSDPPSPNHLNSLPSALPSHDYHSHRNFLGNAQFVSLVSVPDLVLEGKIHQNFRLIYTRDVLLLRNLDDATLSTLNSMVFLNSVAIVSKLTEQRAWIQQVFCIVNRFSTVSRLPGYWERAQNNYNSLVSAWKSKESKKSSETSTGITQNSLETRSLSITSLSDAVSVKSTGSTDAETDVEEASQSQFNNYNQLILASAQTLDDLEPPPDYFSPETYSRREGIYVFLQELVNLAKNVHLDIRDKFYRALCEFGLISNIEILYEILQLEGVNSERNMKLWVICTDILTNIAMHDPALLRNNYAMKTSGTNVANSENAEDCGLLSLLFNDLLSSELSLGMGHQVSCIIRLLFDPDMLQQGEKISWLQRVYSNQMKLLAHKLKYYPDNKSIPVYYRIIELINFCLPLHPHFYPQFLLDNNIWPQINQIFLNCRKPELRCAIVRFLKTNIINKSEPNSAQFGANNGNSSDLQPSQGISSGFSANLATRNSNLHAAHVQAIIDSGIINTIFLAFQQNGVRYNLYNSVVLDLLNHIVSENIEALIENIYINWYNELHSQHSYALSFPELRAQYLFNRKQQNASTPISINNNSVDHEMDEPGQLNNSSVDDSALNSNRKRKSEGGSSANSTISSPKATKPFNSSVVSPPPIAIPSNIASSNSSSPTSPHRNSPNSATKHLSFKLSPTAPNSPPLNSFSAAARHSPPTLNSGNSAPLSPNKHMINAANNNSSNSPPMIPVESPTDSNKRRRMPS
jgi:hypothetical protein